MDDRILPRKALLVPAILLCLWWLLFAVRQIRPITPELLPFSSRVDRFRVNDGGLYGLTPDQAELFEEKLNHAKHRKKVILAWSAPDNHFSSDDKNTVQQLTTECGSCLVIFGNNSWIGAKETGAVVFHYKIPISLLERPKLLRRPDQLYVWRSAESAFSLIEKRDMDFKSEDSMHYNATMIPWRNSGIVCNYGDATSAHNFVNRMLANHYERNITRVLQTKTDLAVAVISNCGSTAGANLRKRLLLGLERNGLKIEKFGGCFDRKIVGKLNFSPELLKYKFYLAFENSFHCRDYITEKFFVNALHNFAVPLVWGTRKQDYEAVAPPNSFIHVDDFSSYTKLVNYIHYLDKNYSAYMEYFRWIDLPVRQMPNYGQKTDFCQLCRVLNGINVDDIFAPGYNRSNPRRPLLTDGVSQMRVPPLLKLFHRIEENDCFKQIRDVIRSQNTLASRKH